MPTIRTKELKAKAEDFAAEVEKFEPANAVERSYKAHLDQLVDNLRIALDNLTREVVSG